MVLVVLPVSGYTKGAIISLAHELCGIAGFEFELEPDEIASALRVLDLMMAEHPFNLMGYNSTLPPSLPEDASGLLDIDVPAAYHYLAIRIAASKGKTLAAPVPAQAMMTYNSASSRYAVVPRMPIADNTVRGSGAAFNRSITWPFINADDS